ncbi:MAG TPA: hypothetical protein VGX21_01390 [Methylomirabilota bacterium]|nr:hypothetical protein [Methylomirabilota bacterium]
MAQGVWIVFPNADALHDGEVHIASNGTEIFASHNLNDNALPRAAEA